jgi:trimeric autotransporter adhesin
MKTLTFFIIALFLGVVVLAQTPQSFRYQAVARDNSGNVLENQPVSFKISILSGSVSGTVSYSETHTGLTTNAFGLVELEIGKGTPVTGTFSAINWGINSYFVKIEMDPDGGTAYQVLSTSQLLSAPYALYAKTVETGDNWGTQTAATDATLTGSGLGASPLKIADGGVTSAKIADGTIITGDLANNAVTSDKLAGNAVTTDKINAGAVTGAKIAQAGATSGQALKWNGTTWAPATDATGGGSSGWTDDGSIIRLTTATDSVQMGSVNRLGKFNVGGNIGLNATSSIYFGSDATRITGLIGGDLRLVAEDLSMLTTEDITFGHFGDETWIKFDNANKRVGIGTLTPSDKLHVVLDDAAEGLSAVRGVAASTAGSAFGVYGQAAGFKGRGVMGEATGTSSIGVMGLATNTSSTGVWGEGSNQGVYGKSDLATGKGVFGQVTSGTGFSGYFDGGKFYISGNTGIGTTTPAKKLHVYGSAQVKDTLFASTVKITNSPRVFYKNSSKGWPKNISTMDSWGPLDSIVVVAPGPGSVLLNVTGFLQSSHTYLGNSWVYVGISASRRSSNFDDALSKTVWLLHETLVGGFYQVPCAVTAVATVASGGTYKYYIVGWFNEWDGEEDEVDFGSGAISALFIPSP